MTEPDSASKSSVPLAMVLSAASCTSMSREMTMSVPSWAVEAWADVPAMGVPLEPVSKTSSPSVPLSTSS